jgi:hypothetical protein
VGVHTIRLCEILNEVISFESSPASFSLPELLELYSFSPEVSEPSPGYCSYTPTIPALTHVKGIHS